ncbi:membrane protein insertase YidC [Deferribacter autotrophicus]|uniref:Membrane protein insertase YidC n=1 Tax=Deferribacter autotrophicus TaxID=500465 RepID=A0A5A8F6G1_9BACT|nr:membrane protein insertase YidC [Deferribacter autotrophicus]KAA0259013.1 membrane protein insertase YidC [Deferribacter autotrophicus]
MDKRTLLAVLLSLLVLMIFQFMFAPTPQQVAPDNQTVQTKEEKAVKTVKVPTPEQTNVVQAKSIETISIKTNYLEINFDKNTGDIFSAGILSYKDKNIGKVVFKDGNENYFRLKDLTFDKVDYSIQKSKDKTTVNFNCFLNDIVISKKYEIDNKNYLINYTLKIANTGDKSVRLPLIVEIGPDLGEGFEESRYTFEGPLMFDGKKVYKQKPKKIKEDVVVKKPLWIGFTSKYFLFASAADFFEQGIISKYKDSAIIKGVVDITLNPHANKEFKLALFTGPKEYKLLKSLGYKFEKSIDFGVFSFLAIPMLNLMNFFYKFIHNYGVAIIILTILIKLITYPLTIKSMTSMKKMQKIQPEIQKIREKFKGDPQKMNAAMMELYRKHGVNPMGGCLPMIIQIPIFFALYRALLVSIELKGSPFFGWITDLSMKDPYYITPILMGVTMFIQQKMTPQAGDPTQQKIFMLMPVIFTFLFLNFPSGLVIYWLTNNVLSIIQQYFINKKTA